MSYNSLISSQVDNAFTLLGDLVVSVTFKERESGDYNFATQSFSSSTETSTTIKAIVLNTKREPEDYTKEEIEVIIKSKDVTDLSLYDEIVIGSKTYSISSFEDVSGFILQIIAVGG
jgi:hypothetical protein